MFDFSLQSILHSNIINFILMIAFFALLFAKLNVKGKVDDAHAKQKQVIKDSENNKEKSIFELKGIRESVKNLGAELEKITNDGKEIIANLKRLTKQELQQIEEGFKKSAARIFGVQEENAKHETKTHLAKKGVEIAEGKLKEALARDKKLHKKFIDDAINELDGIEIK